MGKRNKLLKGGLSRKNHLTVMKSKKPATAPRVDIEEEESIEEKPIVKEPAKPKPLRHRRNVVNTVLSKGQKRRQQKKEKFTRR
jgi:hypothetical protein